MCPEGTVARRSSTFAWMSPRFGTPSTLPTLAGAAAAATSLSARCPRSPRPCRRCTSCSSSAMRRLSRSALCGRTCCCPARTCHVPLPCTAPGCTFAHNRGTAAQEHAVLLAEEEKLSKVDTKAGKADAAAYSRWRMAYAHAHYNVQPGEYGIPMLHTWTSQQRYPRRAAHGRAQPAQGAFQARHYQHGL